MIIEEANAIASRRCRVFVGDAAVPDAHIAETLANSRGLAYGDGVFETMRAHRGVIHWWPAHWARLAQGAQRLGIPLPSRDRVEAERDAWLCDAPDAAIKLMLIRGSGGRGYAPLRDASPLWLLSAHPLPPAAPEAGLRLRWCETRLAAQPRLAGLKHCNRLEQVLARAEWDALEPDEAACDEGLMRDDAGDVMAAISANLFVYRESHSCGDSQSDALANTASDSASGWLTPRLDRCGIAGVCRAWALTALDAREVVLSPEDVLSADAVFLCNALRGILPMAQLGTRRWMPHPAVAEAQRRLVAAHPGFAHAMAGHAAGAPAVDAHAAVNAAVNVVPDCSEVRP
jgi:4-amino-4-deoxychorismate lyase